MFRDTAIHCGFPNETKKADDVTKRFKNDDPTKAKNYRPVSALPVVSTVSERIMQKRISEYINQFLSPYLCGYGQGFSTQQALVSLTEKWKTILFKNGYAGAVLMDLSKAFFFFTILNIYINIKFTILILWNNEDSEGGNELKFRCYYHNCKLG